MGGTASKYDDTNWETSNGGLVEASQTLDGMNPVDKCSTFYVVKKAMTNRREYEIKDDQDILLYTTKPVGKIGSGFDVLDKGGLSLLRVQVNLLRTEWEILAYKPAFAGQQPDPEPSEQSQQSLYKKACFACTLDKQVGSIFLHGMPEKGEDTDSETLDPTGVLSKEPLLKVASIRGMRAKFQTYLPTDETQLVGYWSWENSFKNLKMKMQLAKGTDLVLHVVIAILTNLVREEGGGGVAGAGAGAGAF